MKYSKIEGMLGWSGGNLLLRKGMSFDNEHPLVSERPDIFTDVEPGADVPVRRVETGQQRPGQFRSERPVVKAPPRGTHGA